jgi:probable phosphoglycerate mutase
MQLVLVRHGDAYAGFDGVVSGPRGCKGLTELGRRQAEALRSYLATTRRIHADALAVSVLPRAIETAQIIAPALGIEGAERRCDLCEIHTGEADGLLWSEYAERYGAFDMEAYPNRVFAPGGESWRSFHERVARLCKELASTFANQTVVAVCHAGVIMASIRVLFGIPDSEKGAQLRPANTGLTEWHYEPEGQRWTLHSFNEHTHLMSLGSDPWSGDGK